MDSNQRRFEFLHNADIMAGLRPVEWRIHGIMTDNSLTSSFGEAGHFKTFMEIDRGLCIAAGIDYHGHPVKQGTVFYIAGEGQQGIGRRIAAWHIAHGTKSIDVPFFISRTPMQLMEPGAVDDVRRAVDDLSAEYGLPALVIIDTLVRNFGDGDENSTRDMSKVISNLDLSFGNDFCRDIIHHTGQMNKERARGSYVLKAAADIENRVSLTAKGQVLVECLKMKDAARPPAMLFNLNRILLQIGDTEDSSYVLELSAEGDEAAATCKPKAEVKLKAGLGKAVKVLRNLYRRYQENLKKGGRPNANPMVSFFDWRDACMDAGLYSRKDSFNRAFESILLSGVVELDESKKFVYLREIICEDDE